VNDEHAFGQRSGVGVHGNHEQGRRKSGP
jgi:hypothetical protein